MAFIYDEHFIDTTFEDISIGEFFFLKSNNHGCCKILSSPGYNPRQYNAYDIVLHKAIVVEDNTHVTGMTIEEYHAFLERISR